LIYDAGDTRTTWVSFWKAMALLQFGTTLVFAVPPLWKNENQPDPNVRKGQAILGKIHFHFTNILRIHVFCSFSHVFLSFRVHPFPIFNLFNLNFMCFSFLTIFSLDIPT
jgi:hypothetical protein